MNSTISLGSLVCFASISVFASPGGAVTEAKTAMARLPLRFESNHGRMDSKVRYVARTGAYTLLLTASGPALILPDSRRIEIRMVGAKGSAKIEPISPLATRTDSFVGGRENWRTGIPSYERVQYSGVYPGIDVVYYGTQKELEFDFIVKPGADPRAIRMQFDGATRVKISPEGDLLVEAGGEKIVQRRPVIYQAAAAQAPRREVDGSYVLTERNTIGLRVGSYDRLRPLVIDPVINYLTYLGGNFTDRISAVKLGPDKRLYVAGQTAGGQLSASEGAYQLAGPGNDDGFMAIFDTRPEGANALVYFTYFGGTNSDIPLGIDVDANGFVYLTGNTASTDFPQAGTTLPSTGAATTADGFIMKLLPRDPGGDALWYSTYVGGKGVDSCNGIVVDKDGIVYVVGTTRSDDFPVTSSTAYQPVLWGGQDMFISKIDPNTGTLLYSTYLGGEDRDEGRAIALSPEGLVYFTASTLSQLFPWAGASYRNFPFGAQDAAFGVIDTNKLGFESLVFGAYLGGSGNEDVRGLAIDSKGAMILTGYTLSTDFPVTPDAMQNVNNGNGDAFVAVVDPRIGSQGTLVYATYLGGTGGDSSYDVKGDAAGNIYVTGYSLSRDFPILSGAPQAAWGGGTDVFLTKFRPGVPGREALLFSTYVGATGTYIPTGLAVGADGSMYVGGYGNFGLPVTAQYVQGFQAGISDGFLMIVQQ